MAKYEMKYMFDWGSGTCVWSENETAINKYDYAVDLEELPISNELAEYLSKLLDWHDKALNWADPASDLLWNQEEEDSFIKAAMEGFKRLRDELNEDYSIQLAQLI